jgi:hypothetical protein
MTQQLWLAATLRSAGLDVRETLGWQAAGGSMFDPVGVVIHDTASADHSATMDAPSLQTCIHGRPGIPGPLCGLLIGYSGTCYLIAAGKANHAGEGGPWRGIALNRANENMFGIELENDGMGQPFPDPQIAASVKATAAILHHLSQDSTWCIGHKEWAPGRKIDPPFDMAAYRKVVAARLNLTTPEGPTVPPTDRTEIVKAMQRRINASGAQPPLNVDGDAGPATDAALDAVLRYQQGEMKRLASLGSGALLQLVADIRAAVAKVNA